MLEDERIATPTGAMLADPAGLGNLLNSAGEAVFEPQFWDARGELVAVGAGRGSTWFLGFEPHRWVLRHYRRGGYMARWTRDRYLWTGEERVRAFAEYRLLGGLVQRGLSVPRPVAARYQRTGVTYRCDLIMQRIADARPLSAMLAVGALSDEAWHAVGAAIARLHRCRVDHADLNAHNILLALHGTVSVIDFDRGRVRVPGAWAAQNLRRLRRSLAKVTSQLPPDRFSDQAWERLLAGYASVGC